jgi:lysophospholipase L1-like esterase
LAQVEAYAAAWHSHNAVALGDDGPLWVVLGTAPRRASGRAATCPATSGWCVSELEDRDRLPWRVVNLSRSGARTREVVDVQWPAASQLPAALVTAVVGGNDALHTREQVWRRDAVDLCAALPPGAVVATVARGVFERKTARVNAVLRAEAAARGLRLADLWTHTGPPYRGLYFDGFHPNDAGYLQWADALWEALDDGPAAGRLRR